MGNILQCKSKRSHSWEAKHNNKKNKKKEELKDLNEDVKRKTSKSEKDLLKYQYDQISEISFDKSKKESTIIRGLNNIGATCYMNATLQSLSNTAPLTDYFLTEFVYIKEDDTKKISNEYYILLKHLWNKNAKKNNSYSPTNFKKILSEENPLFSGIAANDSKDLLNFLLERLHKELNSKVYDINNENNNSEISDQVQLNEKMMQDLFFKDFTKNYRSIISDLFYFTIETKTQCFGCKNIKYNFQVCPFLEFPLEEVNKYCFSQNKIMSLINVDGSNPDVNIYDCFEYYHKVDVMTGDNQMYCNICHNSFDSYYSTNLCVLPRYLIINLNRGKNAVYQCKVNFPEEIDLTNYVTYKNINTKFELYAVICHIGPSSMSRHFVAYCRNRMDKKWYLYNEAIVTLCQQSYEYQNKMPYILFYRSLNFQ